MHRSLPEEEGDTGESNSWRVSLEKSTPSANRVFLLRADYDRRSGRKAVVDRRDVAMIPARCVDAAILPT
jgi:hypothetical protein